MTRFILGFILGASLNGVVSFAAVIPSPPLIEDKKVYLYLRDLWNNLYSIPVVSSNPNGNRRGKIGDTIWWNDSGTYRLRVNTDTSPDGGTTWVANS